MTDATPRDRGPLSTVTAALMVTAVDAALLALALGGVRPLFAHPRALALLAVWLVGGLVLALLRPVRTDARERTLAEPRTTLPLLLILPFALAPLSAWGERAGLAPLPGGPALRWAGVALSGAGLAVRIAAMARLGSRFSPLIATQRGATLETGGPYALVRHPGYLGSLAAALGTVLAFGSAVGLAAWLPFALLLDRRMRREDAFLESAYGDKYRSWRDRTGRVLPRVGR